MATNHHIIILPTFCLTRGSFYSFHPQILLLHLTSCPFFVLLPLSDHFIVLHSCSCYFWHVPHILYNTCNKDVSQCHKKALWVRQKPRFLFRNLWICVLLCYPWFAIQFSHQVLHLGKWQHAQMYAHTCAMWACPCGLLVLIKKEFSIWVLMRSTCAMSLMSSYTHSRTLTHTQTLPDYIV